MSLFIRLPFYNSQKFGRLVLLADIFTFQLQFAETQGNLESLENEIGSLFVAPAQEPEGVEYGNL